MAKLREHKKIKDNSKNFFFKFNKSIHLDEKRWNIIITSHIKMDIHETILGEAFEAFLTEELEEVIKKLMEDNEGQNQKILPYINFFYENYVKQFLIFVAKFDTKGNYRQCNSVIKQLDVDISHIFIRIHSPKIFDFLLQMEESVGVMEEIKKCLDISNMLDDVTTILVENTQKRQLIAGVMTDSNFYPFFITKIGIIEQYINTVKTLQILDPEGYYFEKVITPIKKYLFKRPDVLRCIISLWIDDM